MKSRTESILTILKVLSYIALIGFAIRGGSQIISLIVSFFNPSAAKDIGDSALDLFTLYERDQYYYIGVMTLLITISCLQVWLWESVTRMLSSLNLQTPFSRDMSDLIGKIAIQLVVIWCVSYAAGQWIRWVSKHTDIAIGTVTDGNEYLFVAGIVYVISQVFKRGIELQEENELTV